MKMIYGTGIDIVNVSRFKELIKNPLFLEKVFTVNEIEYCSKQAKPIQHYAARFAAKEAFFKALGTGVVGELEFFQIEVTHNEFGKPVLVLLDEAIEISKAAGISNFQLSLSHEDEYATAIVILEK